MKRSEFIKSIGLGANGLILPKSLLLRNEVKVYDNYLRGLQHYQFDKVAKKIKKGDQLILIREPQNAHDSFAIQVYYHNLKLGYIPAFENIVIANMLDASVELKAYVSYYENEKNPHKMETLGIEIFTELITATPQLISELQNNRANDVEDIYRKGYNF